MIDEQSQLQKPALISFLESDVTLNIAVILSLLGLIAMITFVFLL